MKGMWTAKYLVLAGTSLMLCYVTELIIIITIIIIIIIYDLPCFVGTLFIFKNTDKCFLMPIYDFFFADRFGQIRCVR
jgi:hypothetical protein